MAEKALGLIEVRGFLGAVVVADAALKAANVSLLNVETVKSGLNTVQLVGDVSAVRSAVEAAVEIAQDQPYYLHSHVIARLDSQTDSILLPIQKEVNKDVRIYNRYICRRSFRNIYNGFDEIIRTSRQKNNSRRQ